MRGNLQFQKKKKAMNKDRCLIKFKPKGFLNVSKTENNPLFYLDKLYEAEE